MIIKSSRNYNIWNNVLLNNNFQLQSSEIAEKYNGECLISKINRLSEFYRDINHIRPKEYRCHFLTEKHCSLKIKKCIFLNKSIIAFIFEKEKYIYFIYKNTENLYKITCYNYPCFINSIYPLNENKFIYFNYSNTLNISNIEIKNYLNAKTIRNINNIDKAVIDLYDENNGLFMIEKTDNSFNLKYYNETLTKNKNKEKIENNMYLILKENKKCTIKYIFNDINERIEKSELNDNDKEILKKNIFL